MADTAVKIPFAEAAAPSTPASGKVVLYAKTDGLLYSKDDAGTETLVSGGAGGGSVATDAIFDAKGDLPAGTGSNTAAKRTVGSNGTFLQANSGDSTGLVWATAGLLAINRYAPTSQTVYSTSSTSMTDVDASNMLVTFTAPLSGNVLVRLNAFGDTNGAAGECYWGLREASSNLPGIARVLRGSATHPGDYLSVPIYVTGLTPGNSYTYKWSYAVDPGTSTTRIIVMDGSTTGEWSPGIMEVWAAP